jgi:hypothetical protein
MATPISRNDLRETLLPQKLKSPTGFASADVRQDGSPGVRLDHPKRISWFWADVSFENDLCSWVVIGTRRFALRHPAHYGYVLVLGDVTDGARTLKAAPADYVSPQRDGRDLVENLRHSLRRHEASLIFLMNERLRRFDYHLTGQVIGAVLHRETNSGTDLETL